MSLYDPEQVLDDIETYLKNNLNTKISAINTEKGDTITLATIDSNAYFPDLEEEAANYDPFILLDEVQNTGVARGPAFSQDLIINVSIVVYDGGANSNIRKRMLRYRRALQETMQDAFNKIIRTGQIEIQSLPIFSYQRSDNEQRYKISGIDISTSIG